MEKNDQIAVDKFKKAIDEYINFITQTAYSAGIIAGTQKKDKTCEGCVHYNTEDNSIICFDCDRMIRDDYYEVKNETTGN